METSDAGASETSKKRDGDRPDRRTQAVDRITAREAIRVLLGIEAASFLLAATIHAGVLVGGYEHSEAMIAESVIGTVLVAGLAATWLRPRSTFTVAAGVQTFALLGTLVGLWTIIVGVGPRTVPDVVYHVVIVIVLAVGIRTAWRNRGTNAF
ncbi:hypothetical protein [Natrialba asiatica]|nr:hypothetical protein [Natrialba asiatica]